MEVEAAWVEDAECEALSLVDAAVKIAQPESSVVSLIVARLETVLMMMKRY